MKNEKIHLERIDRFVKRLKASIHTYKECLVPRFCSSDLPIPYAELDNLPLKDIHLKEIWANAWGSAWFIVKGIVPEALAGKECGLFFDCEGEACVFKDGYPHQGLTPKVDWYHNAAKHYYPLFASAKPGDSFEIIIEAASNDLFGSGKDEYRLMECALVDMDEQKFQLLMDVEILFDLAKALPGGSVRRARILYGLNNVCNVYAQNPLEARRITQELLSKPANASALKAISVGHAHLDLAWLWPIRETRRKAGRTFANALRLLERYPMYIFGASQAQLYKWVKTDYPQLYEDVKAAIIADRWEVQGASWVEFDTNITGGESIIRQFMYGKKYFSTEFGFVTPCLWLPDCFGFSANMPQFMAGCRIKYFVTQKLSWNETNVFDKHLFIWQGLDGSEVLAHQMPTNDYNCSNNPSALIATESRFAQAEVADAYLNLFGIGDGGGGPTRNHIEYGIRQQNLEGSSKFCFAASTGFFDYCETIDRNLLPRAFGELYLEFHRGTYTTQARMKQNNARSERLLMAVEAMCATLQLPTNPELQSLWEDTLLHQFHDILPGSSIGKVYEDAAIASANIHAKALRMIHEMMASIPGGDKCMPNSWLVFNPCGQDVIRILHFPSELQDLCAHGENLSVLAQFPDDKGFAVEIAIRAWSWGIVSFSQFMAPEKGIDLQNLCINCGNLQIRISPMGSITSIFDISKQKEYLCGESNLLMLWEDEPNNWGAWDINHFYRETQPILPHKCELVEAKEFDNGVKRIVQDLWIGSSTIRQIIELGSEANMIRIHHQVQWQEHHKMLRVRMLPAANADFVNCGVQMGNIQRPVHANNDIEAARFEFPAQGFVDYSDGKGGITLLCAEKYGFSVHGKQLEMALLRSPADVDPKADLGEQNYTYGLYIHEGSFADSNVSEVSEAFGTEILCHPITHKPAFDMVPHIHLSNSKLVCKTLKPSEDGKGIVLRIYEPLGYAQSTSLHYQPAMVRIYKCNMLEEVLYELPDSFEIPINAHEILTLKLEPGK